MGKAGHAGNLTTLCDRELSLVLFLFLFFTAMREKGSAFMFLHRRVCSLFFTAMHERETSWFGVLCSLLCARKKRAVLSSTAHSPEMGERIGAVQFDVGGRGGE